MPLVAMILVTLSSLILCSFIFRGLPSTASDNQSRLLGMLSHQYLRTKGSTLEDLVRGMHVLLKEGLTLGVEFSSFAAGREDSGEHMLSNRETIFE